MYRHYSEPEPLPWADACFKWVEACTVIGIVVLALAGILYELFWIVTGGSWADAHGRFRDAVRGVDTHWKLALILAVPLFYRTTRKFLDNLMEIGPFKRHPLAGGPPQEGSRE